MPVTFARSLARRIPQVVVGLALTLLMPAIAAAQTTHTVATETALRAALGSAVAGDTIAFAGNIALTQDLPSVGTSITIEGGGHSLSGNSQYRGLFVAAFGAPLVGGPLVPRAVSVTIQNLTIRDTVATGGSGGAGGPGGGGGAGMGGALFVGDQASVSVSNVNLLSNAAVGGVGGAGGTGDNGGGGGGLGGNGGTGDAVNGPGGGGGVGVGAAGGGPSKPGLAGIVTGVAGGGGGGDGGNAELQGSAGGVAGFGGGGGGAAANASAGFNAGGFGGGGGGTSISSLPGSGAGGYGGGGGGGSTGSAPAFDVGGTFGGSGGVGAGGVGGGGGAGLGGAIFVQPGGNLTIGGAFTLNGASVTGGTGSTGGANGSAAGSGIFFAGSGFSSLTFAPAASQTATVANDIVDEFGVLGTGGFVSVAKDGAGTLVLSGNNLYSGGTYLNAGTLRVSSDANLGATGTDLYGNGDTTLQITSGGIFSRTFYLGTGIQTLNVAPGQTVMWSGNVTNMETLSTLNVTGGGTLALTSASNSQTVGTSVNGNSTLIVGDEGALGDPLATVTLGDSTSGGTLRIDSPLFLSSRLMTLQAGGGTIDTTDETDAVLGGSISGTGNLTKSGNGLLTLSGANSYAGATAVNAGILRAGSNTAFGLSRSLSVGAAGTADFNGFNQTFFTVGGTGTVALNCGATLTVGSDNSSSAFAGTIDGDGGLVKAGSGALSLSGTNTFTGGIALNGGTLRVSADANLGGAGAVRMSNAATLGLASSGSFAHTLLLEGTSSVNVGAGQAATWSGLVGNNVSAGILRLTGGGALSLANAANTYSGGTIVTGGSTLSVGADTVLGAAGTGLALGDATTGGTLAINAPSFLSSRAITLGALGGTINTASTTAATLGGVISGTGALIKAGTGALALTRANTFGGGLTLGAGTVNVSADANLGGAGAVRMSSATTLGLTGSGVFAHTLLLAGTSSVNVGAGQAATWSGLVGNNVSAGILRLTGGGAFSLTNTANTYSGGTIVTGGSTLLAGADSVLGAVGTGLTLGDATTGGTLAINAPSFLSSRAISLQAGGGRIDTVGATAATLGGVISGAGGLTKAGTGALTLSGANTYTGGTFLIGGSIVGTTNSLQGTVINSGELVFNQGFNGLFRGVVTGVGSLTKLGLGTASLSGAQGFTGLTWIREGTLAIDTRLPGSVKVDAGATLWASGAIGGSLDVAGALLVPAPGSQFATFDRAFDSVTLTAGSQSPSLLINGNLATTSGSTIGLSLSSGGAPPIVVNGAANLVGTHFSVTINDPNPARATTFVALSAAGGLRMTGVDVSSPSTTLEPLLKSNAFSLMVTLLNYGVPLCGAARTPNAVEAARGVDAAKQKATGDFRDVVNELTALDDVNLDSALRSMAGEIHASAARLVALDGLSITDLVRTELSNREFDAADNPRPSKGKGTPRFWFQLSGDRSSFSSGDFSGGTANVGGGGGGVDFTPGSNWVLGAGVSVSLGDLSLSDLSETSKMTAPRAFTYFGLGFGPFNVHWGGSVARSKTTTKRHIQFAALVPDGNGQLVPLSAGIDRDATSDQVSTTRDAWSDWQFTRKFGTWTFDGKLGVRVASYSREGFSESGADSISLDVRAQTLSTREFNIDLHHFRRSGTWRPNILVMYRREFGDDWTRAKATFAGDPNSQFSVQGMPVPRDTFQGLGGLTMRSAAGLLYTLEYQFLRSTDETRHSVRFRVRF